MSFLNIEIKARCPHPDHVRAYLLSQQAHCTRTDHQVDTYFNVHQGRLKLREGHIENNLIFYERGNQAGPRASHFQLVQIEDASGLKTALTSANGIKVVVRKKREIYYIDNVKFHIDEVEGLGSFVEIEAGNVLAPKTREELQQQCDYYTKMLEIQPEDMLTHSYSDMLLEQLETKTA